MISQIINGLASNNQITYKRALMKASLIAGSIVSLILLPFIPISTTLVTFAIITGSFYLAHPMLTNKNIFKSQSKTEQIFEGVQDKGEQTYNNIKQSAKNAANSLDDIINDRKRVQPLPDEIDNVLTSVYKTCLMVGRDIGNSVSKLFSGIDNSVSNSKNYRSRR